MWRLISRLFGGASGDQLATDGARAFTESRYIEAVEKLRKAVEMKLETHTRDKVLTILGNAYCELEEYEKAIATHRQALEINPSNHQVCVNLGIALRKEGSPQEAANCYERAIALRPGYAEAHTSLGALYIFMNEPAKAVEVLLRAKDLDPSGPVTHGNLALALAMDSQFGEAERALKHSVSLGYQNWRAVRERIDQLRELDEKFLTDDGNGDLGQRQESRWDGGAIAAGDAEDFHYVCLGCGRKVTAAVVGEKDTCPACGGSLSRFSAN